MEEVEIKYFDKEEQEEKLIELYEGGMKAYFEDHCPGKMLIENIEHEKLSSEQFI